MLPIRSNLFLSCNNTKHKHRAIDLPLNFRFYLCLDLVSIHFVYVNVCRMSVCVCANCTFFYLRGFKVFPFCIDQIGCCAYFLLFLVVTSLALLLWCGRELSFLVVTLKIHLHYSCGYSMSICMRFIIWFECK